MNGQGIAQFIPLILIFVIFYFFLIRPQQKRAKEHLEMVKGLKRGDEVITSGGIIGTVDRVFEDDTIEVMLADNVKVKVIKNTITSLLKKLRLTNFFCAKFYKIKSYFCLFSTFSFSFFCFSKFKK